jgi:hypothetical protein
MIHNNFEGSLTEKQARHGTGKVFTKGGRCTYAIACLRTVDWFNVAQVTIDMLPDVALLQIFDFYLGEIEAWITLCTCADRSVVFRSPLRLNLQLFCHAGTEVRKNLGVWPLLPIIVSAFGHKRWGVDNIIAALEHRDRIIRIYLHDSDLTSSQLKEILPAMQLPFPALKRLQIQPRHETAQLVIPASFFGGSAPRLRTLSLERILFPGLPKLRLSATHLVHLKFTYSVSPEAMVTCLSALTTLESLYIDFKPPKVSLTRKASVRLRRHAPSSPLSPRCGSVGSANILKTSRPGSMPLYLTC